MPRFLLEPERWGREASLTGDEAHHCARVMRAAPGDRIEVFDGAGRGADATVVSVSKHEVLLNLDDERRQDAEGVRVVLALAALKGKAMDHAIQKSVELGVSEIVPIVTERSIVRDAGTGWQRTVLEACKQCGRWSLPGIRSLVPLDTFLMRESGAGTRKVIASLTPDARPLREILESGPPPSEVVFLVGPEGDFTPEETSLALEQGYLGASLGQTVLRSETAAITCVANARYAFA